VVVTVFGIAAGALLTVLVSRYYYTRSLRHRLAVYTYSVSPVFAFVDPDLRSALTVRFRDREVKDLLDLVLIVANEGTHPIRRPIHPLTVVLPGEAGLLDAAIAHVWPEGRSVSAMVTGETDLTDQGLPTRAVLDFELLNPGDYFALKLLVDGRLRPREVELRLTADNLPPIIRPQPGAPASESTSWFEGGLFLATLAVLSVAASIGIVLYLLADYRPQQFPFTSGPFEPNILGLIATVVLAVVGVLVTIIGLMMLGASVFGGNFPPRRRFAMPAQVTATAMYSGHMFMLEMGDGRTADSEKGNGKPSEGS
jgi:hypothetical protein